MHKEDLLQKLNEIPSPFSENKEGIVQTQTLQSLDISDDWERVTCILSVPTENQTLEKEVERKLRDLLPQAQIFVVTTQHKEDDPSQRPGIGAVKNIIAVASGKGGVGKSTVALNLAGALSKKGLKVGLLDADIYGPSLARLFDIKEKPYSPDGKTMQPVMKEGIATMSMGFVVDEKTPVVWRGPMVQAALLQFIRDVWWGALDVLVIDTPPGTGDAHLTLAQQVSLTGAVIVSTPQDIALIDARKGIGFFEKVNIPILGVIENMSYFDCPHCHHKTNIFSHGAAQKEAQDNKVPFLGEIPLLPEIRETSDTGEPVTLCEAPSPAAKIFEQIADRLWSGIEILGSSKKR